MQRNLLNFILYLILWFSHGALAQSDHAETRCENDIVVNVGKHFNLKDFSYLDIESDTDKQGRIVIGVCKRWPTDKSRTIAAFAYDAGVEEEKLLVLALVDNYNKQIVASYKRTLYEDSVSTVVNLRIDTARYNLAPGVRAFGVDVTESVRVNCPSGGSGPLRTLFVQEGYQIRRIFGEIISEWSVVEGASTCDDIFVVENVDMTIEVSKEATNGYNNLAITRNITYSDHRNSNKETNEYYYDGKEYVRKETLLKSSKQNPPKSWNTSSVE